jgi:cbb3-type cytochrome oxidase maturation protein
MNAVLVTIPLALLLLALAVGAFFWAVDHDQFDDMETPGLLPLDEGPAANHPDDDEPIA